MTQGTIPRLDHRRPHVCGTSPPRLAPASLSIQDMEVDLYHYFNLYHFIRAWLTIDLPAFLFGLGVGVWRSRFLCCLGRLSGLQLSVQHDRRLSDAPARVVLSCINIKCPAIGSLENICQDDHGSPQSSEDRRRPGRRR